MFIWIFFDTSHQIFKKACLILTSLGREMLYIFYHLIWCPKFRYNVLTEKVDKDLREILFEISKEYGYTIKEMEIMPDHIHLFISTKPTVAPADVARTLKSISVIRLFKNNPSLKKFYSRCGSLWSKGYFASTIGKISEETVRKYIQDQKKKN